MLASTIEYDDFSKLDIRTGTIIKVADFPEAKKAAYKLSIDFGSLGVKKSSAQITSLYNKEELLGKQILAVLNLGNKQIANFISECLVLGVESKDGIVLLSTDKKTQNGKKVY